VKKQENAPPRRPKLIVERIIEHYRMFKEALP